MAAPGSGDHPTWKVVLRSLVLVLGLGIIYGVPTWTMVFFERDNHQLWTWDLYRSHGKNVCAVTWNRVGKKGKLVPIDRLELRDVDSMYELGRKVRTIHAGRLNQESKRVCNGAKKEWGKKTRVRLTGACGGPGAWIALDEVEANVCKPGGRRTINKALDEGRARIREEKMLARGQDPAEEEAKAEEKEEAKRKAEEWKKKIKKLRRKKEKREKEKKQEEKKQQQKGKKK